MEDISPELVRRLQVEELWARRNVLADSMNESRRERFLAIYALAQTDTVSDSDAAPLTRLDLAAATVPHVAWKYLARGAWGVAGAAALLAFLGAWNSPLVQAYVSRFAIAMPSAMALPHAVAVSSIPEKAPAAVQKIDLPNLRAQVSAEIAAVKGKKPVPSAAENGSAN